MKKTIFASVLLASAAMVTSCGISAQQPKTEQDTVGYAVGVFIGANAAGRVDSNYNVDVITSAVQDIYKKSPKERQLYLLAAQIANDAFTNVDSAINPATIIAGVTDHLKKTNFIKDEEAGQYVMTYLNKATAAKAEKENQEALAKADQFLANADTVAGVQKTASGLRYKIATPGQGDSIASIDTVVVKYALYDYEGKVLDSGDSFNAVLPNGVVPGFAEGIQLLQKGGKATIWMPATLGYGTYGQGAIKANQALKFDIEVIDIIKGTPAKK